jgi:hypothetical protein
MEGLPSIADILSLPCGGAHEAGKAKRKDKQKKHKKKHKKEAKDTKKDAFKQGIKKMGTLTQEEINHLKLHLDQFGKQAAAVQHCSHCCWLVHSHRWKK